MPLTPLQDHTSSTGVVFPLKKSGADETSPTAVLPNDFETTSRADESLPFSSPPKRLKVSVAERLVCNLEDMKLNRGWVRGHPIPSAIKPFHISVDELRKRVLEACEKSRYGRDKLMQLVYIMQGTDRFTDKGEKVPEDMPADAPEENMFETVLECIVAFQNWFLDNGYAMPALHPDYLKQVQLVRYFTNSRHEQQTTNISSKLYSD
jgi:hypothetical protein